MQVREAAPRSNASLLLFSTAVPPHLYRVPQLEPMVRYDMRVSCGNEVGWSAFSPWVTASTTQGGRKRAPENPEGFPRLGRAAALGAGPSG